MSGSPAQLWITESCRNQCPGTAPLGRGGRHRNEANASLSRPTTSQPYGGRLRGAAGGPVVGLRGLEQPSSEHVLRASQAHGLTGVTDGQTIFEAADRDPRRLCMSRGPRPPLQLQRAPFACGSCPGSEFRDISLSPMREEEDSSSRHLLLSPSRARLHALGRSLILVPPPLGESGSLATRQLQRDTGDVQGVGAPSGGSEQLCQAWVLGEGVCGRRRKAVQAEERR